jgi:Raf kinase inhibitor-like YbhB/YbcL family protein
LFEVLSDAFENGVIAAEYGKHSEQLLNGVPLVSFPLKWTDPPEGTKSFSLVFQDFDDIPEEGFSWIHWLAADIPGDRRGLPENASRTDPGLIQGKNSWMTPLGPYGFRNDVTGFYGGPAPDRPHEYELELFALDCMLGLKPGFYYNELRRSMGGHILASAVLKGIYY